MRFTRRSASSSGLVGDTGGAGASRTGTVSCVVVCSIENLDPMGVHTGDSWTVAAQQTLPDGEYQRLREAAFACARAVGVATGGANVQFAYETSNRELRLITHDLNTLRHLSHRIAVMYLGLIIEEGPTEAVFEEQRHPYTKALLSSVLYPDPETRRERFELRGEIPSPIDLPHGCYLASRCPLAMAECMEAIPPLIPVGDGRTSACIRHELVPTASADEGHRLVAKREPSG